MTEKEKKKRGRPPSVTFDQVMHAALAAVDEDGIDGLSIRGVARRLGVRPMALYAHVDTVSDLETLAFRLAVRGVTVEGIEGDFTERFVTFWSMFRRAMLSHPGAGLVFARRMVPTPETARATDWLFALLEENGFEGEALHIAYNTGFLYTFGVICFDLTRTSTARSTLLDLGLEPEETANLRKHAEGLRDVDRDAVFEIGLRAVLEGLKKILL